MDELEKRKKKLAGLQQNHGLTDAQLTVKAQESLARTTASDTGIDIESKFSTAAERRMASDLLSRYMRDYQIDTVSDRNTLAEVIYYEVLQMRMQEKLNDQYAGQVKAINVEMVTIMHRNTEAIIKLKSTLGLNKSNRDKMNPYDALDHLKKRWKVYRSDNQAGRTIKCPHCFKFILLKMRIESWTAQQHPYFQDNIIYNKHLFAHYGQTVRIDNDFIAGVLETSRDYIDIIIARANPKNIGQAGVVSNATAIEIRHTGDQTTDPGPNQVATDSPSNDDGRGLEVPADKNGSGV